jgi:hypothetical protein
VKRKYNVQNSQKRERKLLICCAKKEIFNTIGKLQRTRVEFIVPVKRPSKSKEPQNYVPCKLCLGFYAKTDLWKHVRQCKLNHPEEASLLRRNAVASGRQLLPCADNQSQGLKDNVLSVMNADEVSLIVKGDDLILRFGQTLYDKHGSKMHLHAYISQKMREVARFLSAARAVDASIVCLGDCINAAKFPSVVEAVNRVAQFDATNQLYGKPSLALKIGHSLRRCAEIVEANALITEDAAKRRTC